MHPAMIGLRPLVRRLHGDRRAMVRQLAVKGLERPRIRVHVLRGDRLGVPDPAAQDLSAALHPHALSDNFLHANAPIALRFFRPIPLIAATPMRLRLVTHPLLVEVAHMFSTLSRKMMLRLMQSRAEKHSGCRIDVARLATDPEYASAIRTLARFTLDAELRAIGDLSSYAIRLT